MISLNIVKTKVVFVLTVLEARGGPFAVWTNPFPFSVGDIPSVPLETKRQGLFLQTSVESFLDNTLEQETAVSPKCVQDGSR